MDLPDHVLLEAIVLAEQVHTWPTLQEQTRSTDAAAGKEKTSGAAAALHLVHPSRHRLAALEEQLGGVGSWPHWAQELATRSVRTATRSEAFKLQLFLLANGAPPLLVAEYCKSAGLLHDRKACDNLCQLLRDVRWGRTQNPEPRTQNPEPKTHRCPMLAARRDEGVCPPLMTWQVTANYFPKP